MPAKQSADSVGKTPLVKRPLLQCGEIVTKPAENHERDDGPGRFTDFLRKTSHFPVHHARMSACCGLQAV